MLERSAGRPSARGAPRQRRPRGARARARPGAGARAARRAARCGGGGGDAGVPESAGELIRRAGRFREEEASASLPPYDVLKDEPSAWKELALWGEPKELFVLGTQAKGLFTLRTRAADSGLGNELGKVLGRRFTRRGNNVTPLSENVEGQPHAGKVFRPPIQGYSRRTTPPRAPSLRRVMNFQDIRQGVLVFEDQDVAADYAQELAREGVAPADDDLYVAAVQSGDLFTVVRESKHVAVVFKRDAETPMPAPKDLKARLVARDEFLED